MTDALALDLFPDEAALTGDPFEEKIAGLAAELAQRAGADGITAADVRIYAARRGWEPPHADRQRAWSFLAPLFRQMVLSGKLAPTGRWRSSPIPKSHGNRHQVYCAPQWFQEPK